MLMKMRSLLSLVWLLRMLLLLPDQLVLRI
jgi:hypothetical protein